MKIAVLASLGLGAVEVRRRPVVAILSTGDELVGAGEPLGPHQVHDANGVAAGDAVDAARQNTLLLGLEPRGFHRGAGFGTDRTPGEE